MHGILGRNMSKSIFNFSGQARDRSDDSDNECRGKTTFLEILNKIFILQYFQLPDTFSPELKNLLESLLQVPRLKKNN